MKDFDYKVQFRSGFQSDMNKKFKLAQKYVDSEVLRRCSPLVPFLSGVLEKSGTINTVIGTGQVRYKTPYARKVYYNAKVKGQRGKLWFERMKSSNKDDLLRNAMKILDM